jgi:hypothetical protein
MSTLSFTVNNFTSGPQDNPDAVRLADGSLVIVWESSGQDGDLDGVYLRRLTKDGLATGTETRVNTETTGSQGNPAIAALSDGGFVVTWHSNAQDGDGLGIYAQRFDRFGTKTGSEFAVNTTVTLAQSEPDVIGLADGGFVITWQDSGTDGNLLGIFQQQYSALGIPVGGET